MGNGSLPFEDYRELMREMLAPVREDIGEIKEELRMMGEWMRRHEEQTCGTERENASNWAINETRWRLLTWIGGALATALLGIAAAVMLGGCTLSPPPQFPTPIEINTVTPAPTSSIEPTMTQVPPTPTDMPPSPTATPPPQWSENLFRNPGFEYFRETVGAEGFPHVVGNYWYPYFERGDDPLQCAEGQESHCNNDLVWERPEYKPANGAAFPNRVHSGESAQQWFCYSRICRAGIYQDITTPSDVTVCRAGAWVQSWSTSNANITLDRSQLVTEDDKANSQWQIVITTPGGIPVAESRVFGYEDGIYDQYSYIEIEFMTTGNTALRVHFVNQRIWPFVNNDNYVDDATFQCLEAGAPGLDVEPTPTRIAMGIGTVNEAVYVRTAPLVPEDNPFGNTISSGTGWLVFLPGSRVSIYELQAFDSETGLPRYWDMCTDCDVWATDCLDCPRWFAVRYDGECLVDYLPICEQ